MSTDTKCTLRTVERAVRLRPEKRRDVARIDPHLRQQLRDVIRGVRPWPLLLYGAAGTGKTCGALALCDCAVTAVYLTVDELADRMLDQSASINLWEWIGGKELAVLDEIGARERVGELNYAAVKRFCDAREGKPTIYITNLKPHELIALYDDRVFSRVACGTWCQLAGEDRRINS